MLGLLRAYHMPKPFSTHTKQDTHQAIFIHTQQPDIHPTHEPRLLLHSCPQVQEFMKKGPQQMMAEMVSTSSSVTSSHNINRAVCTTCAGQ